MVFVLHWRELQGWRQRESRNFWHIDMLEEPKEQVGTAMDGGVQSIFFRVRASIARGDKTGVSIGESAMREPLPTNQTERGE
jgi:hypothetical protein